MYLRAKGMAAVPTPPRAKTSRDRGNIKEQLQAKVSGSLASRGVKVNPDKLWAKKIPAKMSQEDWNRLQKQRENKRRWAAKEREKCRVRLEQLRSTNGDLEFKNKKLKKEVENLRKFHFNMQSALLRHEGNCEKFSFSNSELDSLRVEGDCVLLGDTVYRLPHFSEGEIASLVHSGRTPRLTSGKAVRYRLASDGEEERGPMKRLNGGSFMIHQSKVVAKNRFTPYSRSLKVKPNAGTGASASYLSQQKKENGRLLTAVTSKSPQADLAEESTVLLSEGFTPRGEEDLEQQSFLQMLGGEEELMIDEEISEVPLLSATEIKQEPTDPDSDTFLREIQSCTPHLEDFLRRKNAEVKENGGGAEDKDTNAAGTDDFFQLGSGKLTLADTVGPKPSDAIVSKPKPRAAGLPVEGVSRSYMFSLPASAVVSKSTASVKYASPWAVADETSEVPTYVAEEIVGSSQDVVVTTTTTSPDNFLTPTISTQRRRAASESAVLYSSKSQPAAGVMTTIPEDWADVFRPTPQRTQSVPGSLLQGCEQILELAPNTYGHVIHDGDVLQVTVLDTDVAVSEPETLVSRADVTSIPSTPSTISPTMSSEVIFVNTSTTSAEAEAETCLEAPAEEFTSIPGIIVQ